MKRLMLALRRAWWAFHDTMDTKPRHKATCATGGDPATCPCNTTRWSEISSDGERP